MKTILNSNLNSPNENQPNTNSEMQANTVTGALSGFSSTSNFRYSRTPLPA